MRRNIIKNTVINYPIFELKKHNNIIIDNFILDTPLNLKHRNNFLSYDPSNNIINLYTHDDDSSNQKWIIEKTTEDIYFIKSQSTNKYLGSADKNIVTLFDEMNENTVWRLLKIKDTIYKLMLINSPKINTDGIIYVCQTNKTFFPFMFYPIVYSLMKILPLIYNNKKIEFELDNKNLTKLVKGDTLIWIGVNSPNFSKFTKNGIYTIHFNVEPYIETKGSDEIWTYSLYMYEMHKRINKIIKFIPIIHDDTLPKINYVKNNNSMKLTFFGKLAYQRIGKGKIIQNSHVIINEIYNLWSEQDFNSYIINNTDIFLNIIRVRTKALPSVRINKLLSHKCIIISEHTNPSDEELYKDIIFFRNLNEIGSLYKSLIAMPINELELIAEKAHQKFISIFSIDNAINLIKG
jgi:hypothetical protein